jgi:hypothetical protein
MTLEASLLAIYDKIDDFEVQSCGILRQMMIMISQSSLLAIYDRT